MTYEEALKLHNEKGTKVRRKVWHKNNYMVTEVDKLWCFHRPYYPRRDFERTFLILSNDRKADDWEIYTE